LPARMIDQGLIAPVRTAATILAPPTTAWHGSRRGARPSPRQGKGNVGAKLKGEVMADILVTVRDRKAW